ncbi:unnamed protein product [Ranitomeya imitator]|uniref:ribonuclease H n=1 Tax=Ranitomeya imitator TaxID=111125 RepID=A0ABN9L4S6_9NEOB|nr:unnamed protein product [Ranitomeya imitator]
MLAQAKAGGSIEDVEKDRTTRFCVDYRGLNAITASDAHPMPRIEELLERLEEYTVVYLDDIAIFSSSWDEHLQHLEEVLRRIYRAGLTIKLGKCQMGMSEVHYLGHRTDASEFGLGAVLSQVDSEDQEHPVLYLSWKLLPREVAYSTIEKECLAIVWALQRLQPYLYGRTFTVVTDHNPLCWINAMCGINVSSLPTVSKASSNKPGRAMFSESPGLYPAAFLVNKSPTLPTPPTPNTHCYLAWDEAFFPKGMPTCSDYIVVCWMTTNRMSKPSIIQFKMVLGLAIFFITLLSFIIHLKPNDIKILSNHYLSAFKKANTSIPSNEPNSIDIQISELMTLIDRTVPNVDFSFLNETTSAKNSTATIVEKKPNYCVGDTITVRVEMCNLMGEKKTYGGDFLRARIFSPKLGAGASGEIKDFKNGTYNVYFTLFWEGEVKISVLLMHPSEGVFALWKSRNHGYKYIKYTGKFLNKSQEVVTECGFSLDTKGDKCNYVDKRCGESFYCIKPPGVACEAFVSLKSGNNPYTYLTKVQKNLFVRSINLDLERERNIWLAQHGAEEKRRFNS